MVPSQYSLWLAAVQTLIYRVPQFVVYLVTESRYQHPELLGALDNEDTC